MEQTIITITTDELLNKVNLLSSENFRLVQICCTKIDKLYVDYTFDRDYQMVGLRVALDFEQPHLPSISDIYFAAVMYENEMHDLFGIKVSGMKIDFGGKFYRTGIKTPFNKTEKNDENATTTN